MSEKLDDGEVIVPQDGYPWAYLASVKDCVTSQPKYSQLENVAKLVLTIPHSNNDEERLFSLIRQNKTNFQNSLPLDGTLSSILMVKWVVKNHV